MTERRFKAPWTVTLEPHGESFVVKDATGFSLTWFHFRARDVVGTNPDRMTKEEAERFARRFAKIPDEPRLSAEEALQGERLQVGPSPSGRTLGTTDICNLARARVLVQKIVWARQ